LTGLSYCKHCGAELSEGAVYCSNCGTPVVSLPPEAPISKPSLELAGWGLRLVAWIIDMIILGIVLAPIKLLAWVAWPSFVWAPRFLRWIPFVDFRLDNVIYFLYWSLLDGTFGQSIGKMAMKIKVVQLNGKPIDVVCAVIESLGKAFLLPLDCVIGRILYPNEKQRLFNYISETIIVKTSRQYFV